MKDTPRYIARHQQSRWVVIDTRPTHSGANIEYESPLKDPQAEALATYHALKLNELELRRQERLKRKAS
jgi:hypothetical protein